MGRYVALRLLGAISALAGVPLHASQLPYDLLDLDPARPLAVAGSAQPVIIAVIDDAFAVDHPSLRGMRWRNRDEIAFNGVDDDGNGYVDDRDGWDIADMDGDLAPPAERLAAFDHGVYSAALVADIVRAKLGERPDYPVKLMLIKALSDQSLDGYLKAGYAAIDYAVQNGATVIANAWSGGFLDPADAAILNHARSQDVFIVNSVGNYPAEQPSIPAAHPAVFGAAGVDSDGIIIQRSNYGAEVDLVSIAEQISGPSMASPNAQQTHSGTSVSTPVIAATVALMRLANPAIDSTTISDCLLNRAKADQPQTPRSDGKLGAGLVQIDAAIACAGQPQNSLLAAQYVNAKGSVGIDYAPLAEDTVKTWRIRPLAKGAGIELRNSLSGQPGDASLTIRAPGSARAVLWSGALGQFPDRYNIAATWAELELNVPAHTHSFSWRGRYAIKAVDHEKRFCSGKRIVAQEMMISDASGDEPYAALSNCQWLVRARPGQAIRIEFSALDIDAASDKLYLFRGDNTEQRNLLVTLTGQQLPPTYIVEGGDLLIWFLSDKTGAGQGFTAKISWQDEQR